MSATAFSGIVQLAPSSIFSSSATQEELLGAVGITDDGRQFRYASAGGVTLAVGTLQQSSAESTANWENLAVAAAAIGATTVTTTTTVTLAANALAGGSLNVTTSSGAGYSYRIKSHPAASVAVVTLTLDDAIIVALTTSSRVDAVPSNFSGVIINPTTATGTVVGTTVYPITTLQYGWLQTNGVANVLAQGTIVVGEQVAASSTTAGAVVATSGVLANVGYAVTGIATTEYGAINLNIN